MPHPDSTLPTRSTHATLTAILALILWPPAALGASMSARWNECGKFGDADRLHSCQFNQPTHLLVTSFVLSQPVAASTVRAEFVVRGDVGGLPPWWRPSCRPMAFQVTGASQLACSDPFEGRPTSVALSFEEDYLGDPSAARVVLEMSAASPAAMAAGIEFGGPVLTISGERTTGADACPGCPEPACLELLRMEIGDASGPSVVITPARCAPVVVTWQGGHIDRPGGCLRDFCDPVQQATWGRIKTTYR